MQNDLKNIKEFVDQLIANGEELSFESFVSRYITAFNSDFNLLRISALFNNVQEFQKAYISCVVMDAKKAKENGIYVAKAIEGKLYADGDEWLKDSRRDIQINHANEVIRHMNSILGEKDDKL